MKTSTRLFWTILLGAILLSGCSGNSGLQPNADISPGIDRESGTNDSHSLLGYWQGQIDPASKTIEFIPLRETELHLNALPFLEPPANLNLTLESVHVNGNIITADIGLTHPFTALTQFTGFDVCGIFIAKGSKSGFADTDIRMSGDGDTRLLNPDGYSRWWNPVEFPINNGSIFAYTDGLLGTPDSTANFDATLNGYKYYCDDLNDLTDTLADVTQAKRGMFSSGNKNVRRYIIQVGQGLIFNYAVDASWKFPTGDPPYTAPNSFGPNANRPEAWNISVTEVSNKLWNDGISSCGGLSLSIDVYDWFNAELNSVRVESSGNFTMTESSTPAGGGVGFSTYNIEIPSATPLQNSIDLLISVGSDKTGYGGLLPGKRVTSYFTYTAAVEDYSPGWALTWGGGDYDSGAELTLSGDGTVYSIGRFYGAVDLDPGPGVDNHTSNGSLDALLSKFDACGDFKWALNWGGEKEDVATGVTTDGNGDIYVTGCFEDTVDFDPGPGVDIHTSNSKSDVYLSKFDSNGGFLWVRTWGSFTFSYGISLAVDENSNVYITGQFSSVIDFDPGPGVDEHTPNGNNDIYLTKFDPDGNFQWARTWGGGSSSFGDWDWGEGVAVEGNGGVYVTGSFVGSGDFDPGPEVDNHSSLSGTNDIFLSKFDSDGDFQWARTWGGGTYGMDSGYGVTINEGGDTYITGTFRGTVDFDPGPNEDNHIGNGFQDIFLCKFNPTGDFQWARTWGGGYYDSGFRVAVDGSGFVLIVGYFRGTVDFDPGFDVDNHITNGDQDAFLSKFDPNGNLQWARNWGGDIGDCSYGVDVDGNGVAYITGTFQNTADFDPGPGIDNHTSNGDADAFLSTFPPDGNW